MEPKLGVNVRRLSDGGAAIDIIGEVTAQAEKILDAAFGEARAAGTRHILLDFSRLTYMNSNGVGLLVKLLARARGQRIELAAVGLNDHYRRIFQVTRLEEGIPVFGTEAQAIAAARGRA
jgi:anti-sigma B factor antagonist